MVKKAKSKNNATKDNYFKSVIKEMKLVKWPTWKEVLKNTLSFHQVEPLKIPLPGQNES